MRPFFPLIQVQISFPISLKVQVQIQIQVPVPVPWTSLPLSLTQSQLQPVCWPQNTNTPYGIVSGISFWAFTLQRQRKVPIGTSIINIDDVVMSFIRYITHDPKTHGSFLCIE